MQGLKEPNLKYGTPESESLGLDHVLPLSTYWRNMPSIGVGEHALAHDPATDHFWIVAQPFPATPRRLEVAACLADGQPLRPPVDVMPLLPPMTDLQSAITYGPGNALYLAVQGTAGKQGQQAGILRSTDEGATWSLWWHRPDNGYRLSRYGPRLSTWNDQVVLLYSGQKAGASSGLFADILQPDGTAASPLLIAADPPNDDRDLRHVLVTPDALHVLTRQGGGPLPHSVAVGGIAPDGQVLPIQPLPIATGHRLVDAALLADADGDPVALVKLDTPPSGLIGLFSRSHPNTQVSNPRVPTLRYAGIANRSNGSSRKLRLVPHCSAA